jgi:hypothetical protein
MHSCKHRPEVELFDHHSLPALARFFLSERAQQAHEWVMCSMQRNIPKAPDDGAALTANSVTLARQYGCCGYRNVTALLAGRWP